MVRIYRYVLVAVLIALIAWGIWYVVSHCQKQSTYEEGVLVQIDIQGEYGRQYLENLENQECQENSEYGGKEIAYGTGYYLY